MKRRYALIILVFSMLIFAYPVFAVTTNVLPAYLKITIPISSAEDNFLWAYTDVNEPTTFKNIYIAWKVQNGDTFGIRWFDESGSMISETLLDTVGSGLNSSSNIIAPSGAVKSKLFLASSSTEGIRYVWYTEAQNNLLNMILFANPDTSDYVGGTGGTIPQVDIGWGAPGIPNFILPPEVLIRTLIVPNIYPPTIRQTVNPGEIVVSNVVDSGGNAVAVPIPVYTQPEFIGSPGILPLMPDPIAALPPRQAAIPRNDVSVKDGVIVKEAVQAKETPKVPQQYVRVMPNERVVMERQIMGKQIFSRDTTLTRQPVLLQENLP